jgi:hypothetical protein
MQRGHVNVKERKNIHIKGSGDAGIGFLWNAGNFLADYTTSHTKRE